MAENNNKLIRFFSEYSEIDGLNNIEAAPDNVNYLTDADLSGGLNGVVSSGIPYGSDAKSNIINSILRQVTLITYGVAELMATHGTETTVINSLTSDEAILTSLEDSIKALATTVSNARILAATKDNSGATALTSNGDKLVTERTVFNAIKDDLVTGPTVSGYALDARQGKVLSDKIDTAVSAEVTNRNNAISTASNAIKQDLKIKYLGNTTDPYTGANESGFLYIWKGPQNAYNDFLEANDTNSDLISRVFAIIE